MSVLGRVVAPTFLMMVMTVLNVARASRPTKRETIAADEVVENPAQPGFVTCFFRSKSGTSYYNYNFEFSVKIRKPAATSSPAIICGNVAVLTAAKPGRASPFTEQVENGFFKPKQRDEKYCDCYRGRMVNGRQRLVKYLTTDLTAYNKKTCSASTCWDTYSKIMYYVAKQKSQDWEKVLPLDDRNLYKVDHDGTRPLAKPPTVAQLLNPDTVTSATGGRVCNCNSATCKRKRNKDWIRADPDNLPGVDDETGLMADDVEDPQDRFGGDPDNLPGVDPVVGLMADDDEDNVGVEEVNEEDVGLNADIDVEPSEMGDIDDAEAADTDTVDDEEDTENVDNAEAADTANVMDAEDTENVDDAEAADRDNIDDDAEVTHSKDDEEASDEAADLPTARVAMTTAAQVATSPSQWVATSTAAQVVTSATPQVAILPNKRNGKKAAMTTTAPSKTKKEVVRTTTALATTKKPEPQLCLTETGMKEEINTLYVKLEVVNTWWTTERVVAAVAAACCIGILIK